MELIMLFLASFCQLHTSFSSGNKPLSSENDTNNGLFDGFGGFFPGFSSEDKCATYEGRPGSCKSENECETKTSQPSQCTDNNNQICCAADSIAPVLPPSPGTSKTIFAKCYINV